MKKKFLWMFMVAVAALTSCSSFEEPAAMNGDESYTLSRSGVVTIVKTEAALLGAIDDGISAIQVGASFTVNEPIVITQDLTLTGSQNVVLSTKEPIICKGSVTFKDLTISASTPVGTTAAIRISADDIDVVLDNVQLTQNTPGQADTNAKASMAIQVDNYGGGSLSLINGTDISIPSNYVRGININSSDNSVVDLLIQDSKIHCGTNVLKPATYSRGLQFGNVKTAAGKPVRIYNSTIEGPYYDINITDAAAVEFDIKNTTFNGRGAFNVWASGQVISLDSCTLIGQNHYNGDFEQFADIKLNNGANNCTLNITDTKFMMNRTVYDYNQQAAILFYGTGINVNFYGNNTIYDNSNDTDSFIGQTSVFGSISIYGIDNIHIMEAMAGATVVTPGTRVTYSETPLP